jgi:hypothetical protein
VAPSAERLAARTTSRRQYPVESQFSAAAFPATVRPGPAAQALAAHGGEVVARASACKDAYFKTAEAHHQLSWRALVEQRGPCGQADDLSAFAAHARAMGNVVPIVG